MNSETSKRKFKNHFLFVLPILLVLTFEYGCFILVICLYFKLNQVTGQSVIPSHTQFSLWRNVRKRERLKARSVRREKNSFLSSWVGKTQLFPTVRFFPVSLYCSHRRLLITNAWLWRLRLPIGKCVWGFPHQAKSLQCQLGVPQFNSILPLSSQRKCLPLDPTGYGLSPTRLSLSPFRWQSPAQVITCASDQPATDQRCQWPLSLGSSRPQGNTSLHLQLMKGHRGTAWWRKVLSGQKGPACRRLCSHGVWAHHPPRVDVSAHWKFSQPHRGFTI